MEKLGLEENPILLKKFLLDIYHDFQGAKQEIPSLDIVVQNSPKRPTSLAS